MSNESNGKALRSLLILSSFPPYSRFLHQIVISFHSVSFRPPSSPTNYFSRITALCFFLDQWILSSFVGSGRDVLLVLEALG